jgi:putative exosortase-associated protein (TIGR04073 family)
MKKYSFAVLSVLFISSLMAVSPVVQADDEENIKAIEQELIQQEQELGRRELELNEQQRVQESYRKLDQRKQELRQREVELNQRERNLYESKKSYGQQVGEKALNGISNMQSAVFEIPKNIINVTNASNVVFGLTGGTIKGAINTLGRLVVGLTDIVTAPIITKPIVYPSNIWEDFDADSTYGQVLRLDNQPERFHHVSTCDIYLDPPCDY